ncbi:LysE family translocator [Neptunicella sp. SCSIO 80796]|uniref:LysE family translocator n=1 Tax=Neptunicella plasticusilytica TaxID=3117012 RepID=UPI003A4DD9D4
MLSIDTIVTFSLAALLLSLSPGPSNLYIMARSINQGYKAGVAAASGLAVGSFIYVIATALGIATLFKYSPVAYTLIKIAGAGYLIYLGIQYLRAPKTAANTPIAAPTHSFGHIFRQSIIVELTNPKTALFFIAFLPQFVSTEAGSVTVQLMVLGAIYALIALCCDLMVATLAGKLGSWLVQHQAFIYWQDKISGSILVGLGSYIGLEEILSLSRN